MSDNKVSNDKFMYNPLTNYLYNPMSHSMKTPLIRDTFWSYLFYSIDWRMIIKKIFNIESVIIISFLTLIKLVLSNIHFINYYFTKDKKAQINLSFVINNINMNTINKDLIFQKYSAIVNYIKMKNIDRVKFVTDSNGKLTLLDDNSEIKIGKNLLIDSEYKNNSAGANINISYKILLYSYKYKIHTLHNFINKCMKILYGDDFKKKNNTLFYFKFNNIGQLNNNIIYEENNFETNKSFKNIFFEEKETILKKLDLFMNNSDWYKNKGLPHTLGLILYGPPGTGKTSCIKAIAKYCSRNIIDIPLSKIRTSNELRLLFNDKKLNNKEIPLNKRIYIFEDIDCILNIVGHRNNNDNNNNNKNNDNKNLLNVINNMAQDDLKHLNKFIEKNTDPEFTLDELLNIMDGIVEPAGRIIIMTTNRYEKLDKALIRPGRIDCHILLDNCSTKIIIQIIEHFYSTKINDERYIKLITKLTKYEDQYVWSPAKITQICNFYKDDDKYLEKIINNMIENFTNEKELLQYFNYKS
jgi:ATP-dependent Zn protease